MVNFTIVIEISDCVIDFKVTPKCQSERTSVGFLLININLDFIVLEALLKYIALNASDLTRHVPYVNPYVLSSI